MRGRFCSIFCGPTGLALLLAAWQSHAQEVSAARPSPSASSAASSAIPSPSVSTAATALVPASADIPACPDPVSTGEPAKLGVKYELEHVVIRGNARTGERVILRYVPFRVGDFIDVEDPQLEFIRFRLIGTGYFRDVQLSLRKGSRRGLVVLQVDVAERNTFVINDFWLGISADATPEGDSRPLTAFAGADVGETNFLGTGVALSAALAVADRQAAYRLRFVDPAFLRSSWIVSASLIYNLARDFFGTRDVRFDSRDEEREARDYAVATYVRRGGEVMVGHDLGTSTRIFAGFHLELLDATLPAAASSRRGLDIEPIDFHLISGRSNLTYGAIQLVHDTRDDPILPTRGKHIQIGTEFGLPTIASDYSFLRLSLRYSQWFTLPWGKFGGHVVRFDGFAGAVFGSTPLFLRFYVGDLSDFLPDRALDLNFDRRPPPNFLRTSVVEMRYEEYAARISAEYRIPIYRGKRSIYGIDLYGSAGLYALGSERDVKDPARGYSGFQKFPLDLTFNLGLRIHTSVGGVVLGIANAVGFLPVRSKASP